MLGEGIRPNALGSYSTNPLLVMSMVNWELELTKIALSLCRLSSRFHLLEEFLSMYIHTESHVVGRIILVSFLYFAID